MREKIAAYIRRHQMIQKGDTVIAGVSGGADSVCLLLVLAGLREELGFRLSVVHVHHGLRAEADREEAYVKELCGRYQVPFAAVHRDVAGLAAREKISCEEAGRKARYDAFAEEAALYPGGKARIAVAHHKNDCAETVLFNLFRGSGVRGLAGIRPVRGNIIRPLLCVTREEIELYLKEKEICYCMDASNEGDDYTRNRIRHHILPYAEREICSGSVEHIAAMAADAAQTEDYLSGMTQEALKRCLAAGGAGGEREKYSLSIQALCAEHPVICNRLLLLMFQKCAGTVKDVGSIHLEEVFKLLKARGNKQLSLPHGVIVKKEYGSLLFKHCVRGEEEKVKNSNEFTAEAAIPGEVMLPDGRILHFERFPNEKSQIYPQKTYTKWFDYDKIEKSLLVRMRRTGDYLTVNTELSHQSLKKYMIQNKIPKEKRDCIFVLADGEHILWVIGYRISQYYKISEDTKTILQVRLEERN